MINIFFYLLILGLCLNTFSLSLSLGHVNRSFMSLASSIPETSIVVVDDIEPYEAYFDEEYFEYLVNTYLKNEIEGYVLSANTVIYYFYPEDDSICTNHRCCGASVSLHAKIQEFVTFDKTLKFRLIEGELK